MKKGKEKMIDTDMILVDRIPQDWIEREVYQDKLGNYYLTQKNPLDDLPKKNVLFGETWHGVDTLYRDKAGSEYTKLKWE